MYHGTSFHTSMCQHSSPHTQILQKTGQIERTVDQDFATEEAKYKVCVHFFLSGSSP